jgi:hypothetical protein
MTIEWLTYNRFYDTGYQDLIGDLVPSRYDGTYAYTVETYSQAAPGHPILDGLPATSAVAGNWSFSRTVADDTPSKRAQVVVSGSASGAAVVAGRHGQGRTVHWNMAGEYRGADIWSPETRTLLVNIVRYVSNRS